MRHALQCLEIKENEISTRHIFKIQLNALNNLIWMILFISMHYIYNGELRETILPAFKGYIENEKAWVVFIYINLI